MPLNHALPQKASALTIKVILFNTKSQGDSFLEAVSFDVIFLNKGEISLRPCSNPIKPENQIVNYTTMINTEKHIVMTAVTLMTLVCITSVNAQIIAYNEITGKFVSSWGGSGELSGDSFDGQNFSSATGAQFFGAENGYFRLIDSAGRNVYYPLHAATTHNAWPGNNDVTHLPNGKLQGLPLKNEHWLGATNDVNYYVDAGDGVVRYFDWGTFVLNFDASWDLWSGGPLDGTAPTAGTGLLDFGGGNAMNENLFVVVEDDGTMGYYNLDTGVYSPGHNATYGSWTTFDEGPLSGLTLTALNANAVGTHNGISYRFMGTSDEGMYFDVKLVPEPSAALLALCSAGLLARRRRAKA